ncbi:MAG: 2-amino-4-hydroxy-6-hydroxymethyldihydropteridine pyrophosphokinae [Gemmatimonadetes bacterium]|nr:2-amino-4-hydroxy-6-hydroxymethyldihydropteridine pyrophosphokinae [Gemmatimonadota bacterium]
MSEVAFIALGANLGDRPANLAAARAALSMVAGVELLAASSVEETIPLGSLVQAPYLNQMLAVATTLDPLMLLARLQRIERQLGRVRTQRWSARTIDLDIVRFGERSVQSPALVLPHPGLPHRDFWQREVEELEQLLEAAA